MNGITIHKDTEGQVREVRYLTDDRDARDGRRLEMCIGWGNNGDWYVVTVPEGERSVSAVRLCTSGGASSVVPGFVPLVAEMFRKLAAAGGAESEPFQSVIIPVTSSTEVQTCTWTYDPDGYWKTSCGDHFCISEGTPEENRMRYCHFCGLRLVAG